MCLRLLKEPSLPHIVLARVHFMLSYTEDDRIKHAQTALRHLAANEGTAQNEDSECLRHAVDRCRRALMEAEEAMGSQYHSDDLDDAESDWDPIFRFEALTQTTGARPSDIGSCLEKPGFECEEIRFSDAEGA